jgi:hypothetical protein
MVHKSNSPHEWLLEKARHWNADTLYETLSDVVCRLDGKSIHDLFQSEMDADGYFKRRPKSSEESFDANLGAATVGIRDN